MEQKAVDCLVNADLLLLVRSHEDLRWGHWRHFFSLTLEDRWFLLSARSFSLVELLGPYTVSDLWHRIEPKGALTGQYLNID